MKIEIRGRAALQIDNLLLDFNGTLAQSGAISDPAKLLLEKLSGDFRLCVATADTRGNSGTACARLPVEVLRLPEGMPEDQAKLQLLDRLGRENTITFGNGRNDALMLAHAAVGVCVLGEEGAHKMAAGAAQVLVSSIEDGLRLIAEPVRLVAALRN